MLEREILVALRQRQQRAAFNLLVKNRDKTPSFQSTIANLIEAIEAFIDFNTSRTRIATKDFGISGSQTIHLHILCSA